MKGAFVLSIILLFISAGSTRAQSLDTVVISPVVGSVIDSAEKAQYHIFPYYSSKIFIRAVCIRNADSTLTLRAFLKPDSVSERRIDKSEFDWIKGLIEESGIGVDSEMLNKGKRTYMARIKKMDGGHRTGLLLDVKGNTVETSKDEIPVANIQSIALFRPNPVGRGIGNGFLIGAGTGMLLGLLEGDDPPCSGFGCLFWMSASAKAIIYGTLLSVPGMVVGGIVGATSVKLKIPIDGSQATYESKRRILRSYSLNR